MIRKLSMLLLLCLLAGGMPARSEAAPGPLTSAEFAAFEAWIREAAKTDGFYTAAPTEDGYALRFKDFVLYADRPELTEETVLTAAVLDAPPEEDGTYPDLRGIAAGALLWDVLSRYPLDNPSLSGTREEAGLCLSGSVPGAAFTGLLHRDGQTALSAVYSLYEVAPGGVRVYSAAYAFSQGAVSMIRVSFAPALLSVQAAQKAFGNCADLMAVREYSAYLPSSGRPAEPFHEEDLLFSGLDFLNLSPDGAKAVLGDPADEAWVADNGGWLHTLSWQGLSLTFLCDGEKRPLYAAGLFLEDDLLEGPRGLMPGASLSDVLSRFYRDPAAPEADGPVTELYRLEDGRRGELETPAEGLATVRYYCGPVMLRLYTEGGTLKNIALQRNILKSEE